MRDSDIGLSPGQGGTDPQIHETHYAPMFDELATLIGPGPALALLRARGGQRASIPSRLRPGHWLIETVGHEAAEILAAHYAPFGSASLDLPLGAFGARRQRQALLHRLIRAGKSVNEIIAATGYSRSAVYYHKRKLREAGHVT